MKKSSFVLLCVVLLLSFSCSKNREHSSEEAAVSQTKARQAADKSPGIIADEEKFMTDNEKNMPKDGLKPFAILPSIEAKERLLEYRISLSYECKDLIKARQDIFPIITRYGFLKSSRTSLEGNYPAMSVDIAVKASTLYETLLELEKLGILLNEQITIIDHTEPMVLNKIKLFREQIRVNRKNKALTDIQSASKTWESRELMLERSENEKDQAEFQEWKIKDTVSWAQIHIYLKSPSLPDKINIPNYMNALKKAAEILLQILYGLIYMAPFILLFILFFTQRKRIAAWFKKKQ